jgi:hypothetical protein
VGRPSLLTTTREQRILAVLEAGGSRRQAAKVSGIAPATLTSWLKRGAKVPTGRYGLFRRQVLEAESGEHHLVGMPSEDRSELQWALSVLRRDPPEPSRAWSEPIVITLDPNGPPGGWEEP